MLRRFLHLRPDQRRMALRAAIALLAVRSGLKVAPLRTLASMLGVRVGDARPVGPRLQLSDWRAAEAASIVDRLLSVGPRKTRCLHRALVLGHLMRRERPCLRIGVRRADGQVEAHAWLEIRDRVVAESDLADLETFRILARP